MPIKNFTVLACKQDHLAVSLRLINGETTGIAAGEL
jgi:hypothetical protein